VELAQLIARQDATEKQLGALTVALAALETRLAVLAAPRTAVASHDEQVAPETLAIIAAAVTAYLGKKVRIRSAKMLRAPASVGNMWALQGRVLVHGSHNPRLRS
jgi:hypothetical protein